MIMVVVGHVLDNKRTIDWKQYFLQGLIKSLQRFQPLERLLKFQCGIQNKNSINTQSTSLSFTLMNSALYSIEDKKLQIYVEIKIIFLFLNFYLLILRKREKHWFVVPLIYAFIGWLPYVPWPGIKPATLMYQDDALTNWAPWPGPK